MTSRKKRKSSMSFMDARPSYMTTPKCSDNTKCPTRKSTIAAYRRTLDKYSPLKEMRQSPLKASQANLTHVIPDLDDQYVDIFIWVINMSEQYFYDNAFLLLSSSKRDKERIKRLLHRGFVGVDMAFFNNLANVALIGKGNFGSVYSCVDPGTNTSFAVKYIKAEYKTYSDHAKHILNYMEERNAIIRSMDSPMVVTFYYALQIKVAGATLLFFELCIGDLMGFIDNISLESRSLVSVSDALKNKVPNYIQFLFKTFPDKQEICFMYIFEIFAAVDFLVKCNIIHQDIKPQNIMVSSNLHLKIGDFGLTYRTRPVHRKTNGALVRVEDIDTTESTNYDLRFCGTVEYQDLELQMMHVYGDSPDDLEQILMDTDMFNTPELSFDEDILEATFLTDTWALGVATVMLLCRGFEIFNPEHMFPDILEEVPRNNVSIFLIHLIARKRIYDSYVKDGLMAVGGGPLKDLMKFLVSIFKPRLTRCSGYTKTKTIYQFSKKIEMRYVDMDILERMAVFSSRQFNRSNIYLRYISDDIRNYFKSNAEPLYNTMEELFQSFESERLDKLHLEKVVDVDPGVTINFFH